MGDGGCCGAAMSWLTVWVRSVDEKGKQGSTHGK